MGKHAILVVFILLKTNIAAGVWGDGHNYGIYFL
jgi:hypothetical protein